ncbi:VRR-NUC domain-containing protein [Saccharospirillum salsuginis]|uniref:phosphodiesterase I n=1 Tax=Saccharospirillum salsuginis TaxID=418750 RepID=A0A918N7J8_9GAMM|nr:VRR-NUC domain-containing protein [Saccharospirillum salsuginis]GGX44240.1 hypothetical protein GCM10007392_08780 [Saccharospirillum salsuginis]
MTTALPDLPEGYYLDNFRRLLDTVVDRYDDLLSPDDRDFVKRFRALNQAPARLLVRLYTRKGPFFRRDKLNYPEIPDLDAALTDLAQSGLVDLSPELTAGELARLLTLAELRRLDWLPDRKAAKAVLLEMLDEWPDVQPASDWQVDIPILLPRHWLTLRRLQLMYFGNEYQSLTDFVLSDLGLFQYEPYSLDRRQRRFNTALEIDQQLALNDLKAEYYQAQENGDRDTLLQLAGDLLRDDWCESIRDRLDRLRNRVGFRLEQWGELDTALALFQTNDQPPARERRCRIDYKAGRYQIAWDTLQQLRDRPRDATEIRFGQRFMPRLARKLSQPVDPDPVHAPIEHRACWPRGNGSVEQLACEHLPDSVWLENLLPLGVFGLIHWDLVFREVPGAFHHPFQQGPADLHDPDFLNRRGTSPQRLYRELTARDARDRIRRHWSAKFGRFNPFVHWAALDETLVLRCFDTVPWEHWVAIFHHLWLDLRRHRAGFPDLFQFRPGQDAGYRFIEIKGPGDRLQDNQRDWLAVFSEAGIPAEVWYVDYA